MKVLVTGAKGQVGCALLASVPVGWKCRGLSRQELDLADEDAIERIVAEENPDLVINAGAYTAVDAAENDRELALAVNAGAPAAFARALNQFGGRLIQISTDYVFDGRNSRPYQPDDPAHPLSIYGHSKLAGECAAGGNAIVLRTSWIYGANGSNFVLTMLRLMREGKPLHIIDDQVGAPSYAPELARVIWGLAAIDKPGVFHHRDAGEASWFEFACAIAEEAFALGLIDRIPAITPVKSAEYSTAASRPSYSLLDDSATRVILNDTARHWRENLRQMLRKLN